jgi:hypothetical protein
MTTLLALWVLASGARGLILLGRHRAGTLPEHVVGALFVFFVLLAVIGVVGFLLLGLSVSS